MPIKAAVLDKAARLLTDLERAGLFAFLVDDHGYEVHLGIADEDRAAALKEAKQSLPYWRQTSANAQTILLPPWSGAGGAHIRLSYWQKNNLGEREQVGVRGMSRLLASDELGRTSVGDLEVPVTPTYVEPSLRLRPQFPVDAVISWVDQSDPAWLAQKQNALGALSTTPAGSGPGRFRSRDELRFLLRSLEAFAPFFRRVFIVTDCRAPAWLRSDHPDLILVNQTSLLGGRPVFNSLAVEAALHHIGDLREHYVYFNDDMFLARPVEPDLFFSPAGLMRLTEGPLIRAGNPDHRDNAFETSAQQARDLVLGELGWVPTRSANHVPLPQRKSVAQEMERRFGTAIEATRRSTFRSSTDTTSATGLIHYLGAEVGAVDSSALTWDYLNTSSKFAPAKYAALLRSPQVDTFCCNDEGNVPGRSPEVAGEDLRRFLFEYFPTPSTFEITVTAISQSSDEAQTL